MEVTRNRTTGKAAKREGEYMGTWRGTLRERRWGSLEGDNVKPVSTDETSSRERMVVVGSKEGEMPKRST